MIKREEVEALLRAATMGESVFPIAVSYVALAELCRTWLAVDGAPVGVWSELTETDGVITSVHLSDRLPFHTLAEGQRVKLVLVPEADSGGDRG